MRLGYLGPEGTFSEEAVRSAPDAAGAQLVALPTVRDTILAVHEGTVDRAVVPIENSLEGPIGVTLDTLASDDTDVVITGEVVVPVSPCLIARDGVAVADIERVLSHPQATSQCARFLHERLPQADVMAVASTAEAVRLVVAEAAPWGALGTRRAAALYGATVLAEEVEDEPGNATRFVWIEREEAPLDPSAAAKTSLVFQGSGDTSPGWLVRCLSEFAFRGVNLTKIESRPQRARLGHYRFFVDCEGAAGEDAVAGAIDGLRKHCEGVKILGSYATADGGAG
ncbi:MAG: prephenate dehydratase [Solirubrobacteraceae bacterium]|jgi:prephenate dehydratase|nr:prephenate dehydratase [Solirubrobacteraceae bacterium]